MTTVYLGISVIMILLFVFFILFSTLYFKKHNKKTFDFLSDFPFEITTNQGTRFIPSLVLSASSLAIQGFVFSGFLFHDNFSHLRSFGILICVVSLFVFVLEFMVFLIPAFYPKTHVVIDVLFFCLSILLFVISGILFMNMRSYASAPAYVLMGIMFLLAGLELILIFNPKISHWADLVSTEETDGTLSVKRPRPFVLAFTEWCYVILNFVGAATFAAGTIYFSLNFNIA